MTASVFAGIKGLMIDLDGTVYVGGRPLPGAAEAIRHVKSRGIVCRFVTNTTTKSLASLHARPRAMDLPVAREELVTAAWAGVLYLRRLDKPRCFFVLDEDTRADYAEFATAEQDVDLIVVGDIGHRWDFALVNKLFRLVMDGADLVALHKGRYFQVEDGLEIDTGAFVSALEYATGKRAVVVGKPQTSFFELAREGMGLAAHEVAMIGDDLVQDVGGAQKAGQRGVLVKTGKYRPGIAAKSPVRPDAVIDSLAEVRSFF